MTLSTIRHFWLSIRTDWAKLNAEDALTALADAWDEHDRLRKLRDDALQDVLRQERQRELGI